DLAKAVNPSLPSGRVEAGSSERLLWQGAPVPGLTFSGGGLFLSAFGTPFLFAGIFTLGLGLRGVFGAVTDTGDFSALGLVAFSLPFTAVGIGLVFGIWWYQMRMRATARYALSDRRAYLANRVWWPTMEVHPIKPEAEIKMDSHSTATSVTLVTGTWVDSDGDRQKTETKLEFLHPDVAHEVYHLVRRIQRGAT
ncbi:MAG: hypothetical protein AAGA78_11860, partial [Pseudomonadota bacterium]